MAQKILTDSIYFVFTVANEMSCMYYTSQFWQILFKLWDSFLISPSYEDIFPKTLSYW